MVSDCLNQTRLGIIRYLVGTPQWNSEGFYQSRGWNYSCKTISNSILQAFSWFQGLPLDLSCPYHRDWPVDQGWLCVSNHPTCLAHHAIALTWSLAQAIIFQPTNHLGRCQGHQWPLVLLGGPGNRSTTNRCDFVCLKAFMYLFCNSLISHRADLARSDTGNVYNRCIYLYTHTYIIVYVCKGISSR